jgi:hypothetical protein
MMAQEQGASGGGNLALFGLSPSFLCPTKGAEDTSDDRPRVFA